MIVNKINSTYFINSLDNYSIIKTELLNKIENTESNSIDSKNQKIYSSDWTVPRNIDRPYLQFFIDLIRPYMRKITEYLMYNEYSVTNIWFQRYQKENEHHWHSHPENHFTNIFYAELPDTHLKTEIIDPITKTIINYIKVKEGDILTIPAQLLHRSPINKTNKIKTIISFNSNMFDANLKTINEMTKPNERPSE